jgi:predicted transcriptional regulator
MTEDQTISRGELLALTAEIVSSHVANNSVVQSDMPDLIQSVFGKLSELATGEDATLIELSPAVPIKKSITDDNIVCLEDGKKLKMLKRHLMTAYGMTPEDYRAKWGLKPDYPMVAPNNALKRQELAKKIGLGRKPGSKPAKR